MSMKNITLIVFDFRCIGMNNDRSEGNFNRNRSNTNSRGPRHWKDNEEGGTPQKNRNHRNFDGQREKNR